MGKKSRKKNKKEKESDGSTGNVNGGGSNNNNNNNNNNHNNNISIPTVGETVVATTTTTTTTMVLTQSELEYVDNYMKLKGYPRSHIFTVAFGLWRENRPDAAADAFIRGAKNNGCVGCMFFYVVIQQKRGNMHLLLPYALEGAIRGHMPCINYLIDCYNQSKPVNAIALASFWIKTKLEFGDTQCTEKIRKETKKKNANNCVACGKQETENNDVTLVKCGICKFYSYCGKDCQAYHWKEGKHMNECRQVIILRKYCKPSYVKEIREAIIDGQDPKEIHTLQRLRMKLGLNRPKEEYEELLFRLNDDGNNNNNNNNIMKRGTKVRIKGLVNASQHNRKFGIVTTVLPPNAAGGERNNRVGVKLSDGSGTALSIKIENLEAFESLLSEATMSDRPNPYEFLVARKDGTVHIGSTPNAI